MKCILYACIMSGCALPGCAYAQGAGVDGLPMRQDIRPWGEIHGTVSGASWADKPLTTHCGRNVGCIVVMNTTNNYEIIGFHIDGRKPDDDGPPQWGANQFRNRKLRPQKAISMFRTGDASMCARLVKVVLRDRRTDEEMGAILGAYDFCDDAEHQNVLIPVKVIEPRVTIEEADEE